MISGHRFYPTSSEELKQFLDKVYKEKLPSKELVRTYCGKAEEEAQNQELEKEFSESWHYSFSETRGKMTLRLSQLEKRESKEIEEMELVFDKESVLIGYKIKINQPEESTEKIGYAYAVLQGVIIGGAAGVAFKFMK